MASATFSDLPTELVVNVFAFIRQKKDQGIVCLVSRSWRELMAPILWEKLDTDLTLNQDSPVVRSLQTLLDPHSGILPHVRDLYIGGRADEHKDHRLGLLIIALPRDKLRSFEAASDVPRTIFFQLLQSQSKLERICVSTEYTILGRADTDLAATEERTWVASLMPKVKELELYLDAKREASGSKDIYRDLQRFVDLHPNLETISLSTQHNQPTSLQETLSLARDGRLFYNLTSVELDSMDLAPNPSSPFSHNFDVARLEVLEINNCDFMGPFFDSLSRSYTETAGKLRELSISIRYDIEDPVETVESIERLLKVCPRLQDLELELTECRLIDTRCFLPHAETLRSLLIGTTPTEATGSQGARYYHRQDVSFILKACTKVTGLAINLPPIDLGCVTRLAADVDFGKIDQQFDEFKDMLAELAECPLHTLRILSLPKITFPAHLNDPRNPLMVEGSFTTSVGVAMQGFATRVLSYMHSCGTAPTLLVVEPIDTYEFEDPPPRPEDYQWPSYTYNLTYVRDSLGREKIAAEPVLEPFREFPDNYIITHASG